MRGAQSYSPGMSELNVEQAATHLPTFAGEARDRGGITFTLDDPGRGAFPLVLVEIAEQACVCGPKRRASPGEPHDRQCGQRIP
jgi:hypothetical protein